MLPVLLLIAFLLRNDTLIFVKRGLLVSFPDPIRHICNVWLIRFVLFLRVQFVIFTFFLHRTVFLKMIAPWLPVVKRLNLLNSLHRSHIVESLGISSGLISLCLMLLNQTRLAGRFELKQRPHDLLLQIQIILVASNEVPEVQIPL